MSAEPSEQPATRAWPAGAAVNRRRSEARQGVALVVPGEVVEAVAQRVAELVGGAESKEPEPWIDVPAAAEYLACRPHRIYELVRRRKVRYRKDGSRLLFRKSDLDRYVSEPTGEQA